MNEIQSLPINDAFLVEEHEGRNNFCTIELGTSFIEATRLLNMEHQVPTVHKLHDKKQPVLYTHKHNRDEQR